MVSFIGRIVFCIFLLWIMCSSVLISILLVWWVFCNMVVSVGLMKCVMGMLLKLVSVMFLGIFRLCLFSVCMVLKVIRLLVVNMVLKGVLLVISVCIVL